MPQAELAGPTSSRSRLGRTFFWFCALAIVLAVSLPTISLAREAAPASADPVLEDRLMRISSELRCLVCQNETIAASSADLAVDLRNQVREMLRAGKSDAEVYQYMTARYGDFVLYRPPVKPATWVLWYGPAVLLVVGLVTLWWLLRRRNRMAADQFDAEDSALPEPHNNNGPGQRQGPTR